MVSRRKFLGALLATAALGGPTLGRNTAWSDQHARTAALAPLRTRNRKLIDRAALVRRHNPVSRKLDPLSPLSLGNGEFAFTADITGLQTFPEAYENEMPLCTMSQWGWHTTPLPRGLDPKGLRLKQYDTHGRSVGYHTSSEGQKELYDWLRENPHRLHLGRIGLHLSKSGGHKVTPDDLANIEQQLDLWRGVITSRFSLEGIPAKITTAVHPDLDQLAVNIESSLIGDGRLAVRIQFPYGSPRIQAADWEQPNRHQTKIVRRAPNHLRLQRTLDGDEYFVALDWFNEASAQTETAHTYLLRPSTRNPRFEFVIAFSPKPISKTLPTARVTFAASEAHWKRFWSTGGAVEFADSSEPRAAELERRVVLSQYLTAIQCAGSMPPQETGLTVNSWYGKFHLEMHWWHAAHFALWNRLPLLEKSLGWYQSILPAARELARSQGYRGVRWPKMVGPDGQDSPSPIGPLLIWQQPHPIFYAELCYCARPQRTTLERYREIVFESAEFMASYAFFDEAKRRFVLGPPVIPAQENHPAVETWNPTLELEYWRYGLKTAQLWRERLGMTRDSTWEQVILHLSPLPVQKGVYLAHENCPQTFTERNHDHPSMLGALGMLPGDGVDRETMRRTLKKVMQEWQWDKTWGWDYGLTAMTAARLGETKLSVEALLMNTPKNRYLANGHNWQNLQRHDLPCYLPGNGGLLYAVALMAGGWQGAPHTDAPGFPADGSWTIKAEGLTQRY